MYKRLYRYTAISPTLENQATPTPLFISHTSSISPRSLTMQKALRNCPHCRKVSNTGRITEHIRQRRNFPKRKAEDPTTWNAVITSMPPLQSCHRTHSSPKYPSTLFIHLQHTDRAARAHSVIRIASFVSFLSYRPILPHTMLLYYTSLPPFPFSPLSTPLSRTIRFDF